jgi:hypothetical protein
MKTYSLNYVCCFLSLFAAVVCAMMHQLGLLLINFFFAVYNWYVAEWMRTRDENEKNSDRKSDD